ncbi:MAG: hypothetical protein ACOC0U_02495 [Desulfovibrionales bacterium]
MAEQLVRKPHMKVHQTMEEWWRMHISNMEEAINNLEEEITDAKETQDICTDEWCDATEHALDEIANQIYHIHEPTFSSNEDTKKIKDMKKRLHDIYYQYRQVKE